MTISPREVSNSTDIPVVRKRSFKTAAVSLFITVCKKVQQAAVLLPVNRLLAPHMNLDGRLDFKSSLYLRVVKGGRHWFKI